MLVQHIGTAVWHSTATAPPPGHNYVPLAPEQVVLQSHNPNRLEASGARLIDVRLRDPGKGRGLLAVRFHPTALILG